MRYIDTHAHITDPVYDESRKQMLAQMREAGVWPVISIGADIGECRRSVALSDEVEGVYATVGLHPSNAQDAPAEDFLELERLAAHKGVVAIGEIGLDYHYNLSEPDVQRYWFRRQIQLANELKMPIVIHSREADQECMDILKEEGAFSDERCRWFPKRKGPDGQMVKDARVLLHCFSGSREMAEQYVKLGATISIAGPVTYKNNKKTPEVVKAVPIEFLLVETDAPYLTPEPFRGKKNKSPLVEYTARRVAAIKEMEYEDGARQTCQNAKVFYGID